MAVLTTILDGLRRVVVSLIVEYWIVLYWAMLGLTGLLSVVQGNRVVEQMTSIASRHRILRRASAYFDAKSHFPMGLTGRP